MLIIPAIIIIAIGIGVFFYALNIDSNESMFSIGNCYSDLRCTQSIGNNLTPSECKEHGGIAFKSSGGQCNAI